MTSVLLYLHGFNSSPGSAKAQQMAAARVDRSGKLCLLLAAQILLEQFGIPQNAIERRPQLMRHVREKLRLGCTRRFCALATLLEPPDHPERQQGEYHHHGGHEEGKSNNEVLDLSG